MNSVLKSRQEPSVNTGQTEEGAEVWRKGGSWADVTAPGAAGSVRPLGVPWRGLCPHTHLANPANLGQSFCSFRRSRSHCTETGVVSDLAVQPQLRISVSFLSFLYPFLHNRFFSDWCCTSWNLSPHLPHSEGPSPASPAAPPTPSSLLITLEAGAGGGGGGPTCRSRIPASLPWCPAPGSSA